ncbi:immune-related, lectin-like receptor 4 [Brachionichthys hirsutus]|uniref:immune-related, lectin-like receptor 4 n=1 Tax=Brachionichthys hirsutus TaxID=412623 RepID=UPI003604FB37
MDMDMDMDVEPLFNPYRNIQTSEHLQQLMAVNTNLSAQKCPKCQKGWQKRGRRCYSFSNESLPWKEAREECRCQGGDLAQINSRKEQLFLMEQLSGKMETKDDKFWIGLTDSEEEGLWLWVDNSPLNSSLAFWAYKQPDDWMEEDSDGEDCARMGEKGSPSTMSSWFDKSCKVRHRHVCEKRALDIGVLTCG